MTGRVRQEGRRARKPLGARHAGMGHELARRSVLLRAAGVPMPVVTYDEARDEIVYPWIPGVSGAERLGARLAESSGRDWRREIGSACADLLRPLVRLHGASPRDLGLAPFDPWRRVRPRIDALARRARGPAGVPDQDEALRTFEALEESLGAGVGRHGAASWVPVHGDFHVGQVLFEPRAGAAWLLDADDLALGPPESDLGNFAAHLATSDHVGGAPPFAAFETLRGFVVQGYAELAGRAIEAREVDAYGAVALLRRALKLHERSAARERIGAILAAARAAAQRAGRFRRGAAPMARNRP